MASDDLPFARRRRIAAHLQAHGGGVAVLAAAPPRRLDADVGHPSRQDGSCAGRTDRDAHDVGVDAPSGPHRRRIAAADKTPAPMRAAA